MTRPLRTSAGDDAGTAVAARTHGLRRGDLLRRITKAVKDNPELRGNRELMRWAALLPHVAPSQTHLVEAADVAINLVVLRGPTRSWLERFELRRLRRAVERNVQSRCPAFYLVRGLAVLTALAGPVVYGIWTAVDADDKLFGLDSRHLGLVALAGVIGSVVSLLTRVPEFAEQRHVSRFVLEAIGFCKPLIGTAFALLAYCLLGANFIPLKPEPSAHAAFLAVLGFVAAFSERFIPDMIFRTEGRFGSGRRRRTAAGAER
jgi:hypothetical protein